MSVYFGSSFKWLSGSSLFKPSPNQPLQPQGEASPAGSDVDEYDLVELPKLGPQGKSNLALAGLLGTMAALMSVLSPAPTPQAPGQITPPTIQTELQPKSQKTEDTPSVNTPDNKPTDTSLSKETPVKAAS